MMRNDTCKKALVLGIIVLFIGMAFIPSISTTIVKKSKNLPFNGNTLYVGGDGPGNYTKIQDAIDDASDGDTVFVYDDSSPYIEWDLLIDKSIKLIGEDKNTTIIDGGGTHDVVYISANGVQISGFTLQNSYDNWQDAGIDIGANNVIVSNNIILDCCDGINMYDFRTNNKIIGNTISSTHLNGIGIWYSCNNNLILNNTIQSNEGDGIELFGHCNNNNILGNIIYSNNHGIYVTLFSNNNMISDNMFSSNKNSGILLGFSSNNIICNNYFSNDGLMVSLNPDHKNIVYNNTVNNKPLVYLEHESDIVVDTKAGQIILVYCDNITIHNQELTHTNIGIQLEGTDYCFIYDNILSDNNRGIDLRPFSDHNNIVGNTISNNSYGIYGPSLVNNIEGNTISNNGHGIYSYGQGGNNIYRNLISNNLYGVKLEWTSDNNISFNNFINNDRNACFHVFYSHRYNNWNSNYWDRPLLLPKLIFGKISWKRSEFYIPWINFDRNPAKQPYDIGG